MKIFVSALRPFLVWVIFQGKKILQWGQRFLQKLSKSQIVATWPYTGSCFSCRPVAVTVTLKNNDLILIINLHIIPQATCGVS